MRYYAYKYSDTVHLLCCLTCPIACCITCPLWCYLKTPYHPCGNGKAYAMSEKRNYMSNSYFERKGRKTNRRNSLSEGRPVGRWTALFRKPTSRQSKSPLFSQLPYEIRALIFEYALSYTEGVYFSFDTGRARFKTIKSGPFAPGVAAPSDLSASRRKACSLIRTCRRIYTEALPILYAKSKFVFSEASTFVGFTHIIRKTHLQHVRSVWILQSQAWRFPHYPNSKKRAEVLATSIGSYDQLRDLHMVLDSDNGSTDDRNLICKWAEEWADQMSGATSMKCSIYLHMSQKDEAPYGTVRQGTRGHTDIPLVGNE
jgi:hypothetical protein